MINILIADDQKLLRESFKHIIENNSDIKVVGSVGNGQEAFDFCTKFLPDVILMDLSMPVCSGTEAIKLIKSKYSKIKILVLTASDDESDVSEALSFGADGYIVKDIGGSELILAIKSIQAGLSVIPSHLLHSIQPGQKNMTNDESKQRKLNLEGSEIVLSELELKIIQRIVSGNDNKQIAADLFMAEGTIKNKITDLILKLRLKNRTQLAVFALKNNLV